MKKTFHIAKILGLVLVLLAILQVIVSNHLATAGEQLTQVDEEIKAIEEENEYLKREIATSSSLTTIAKQAEKKGFLRVENFLYLSQERFAFKTSP